MSTYSLIKRGMASASEGDTSPKVISLASAIKTPSSFRVTNAREIRRGVRVQRGTIAITDADVGGTKDSAAFTAVDMNCSEAKLLGFREKRTDGYSGVSLKLQSDTTVRATFNPPAAGDLIALEFEVVEHKQPRGATLRISAEDELSLEWDGGALAAGESIDMAYEVFDYNHAGDDIKELLFRAQLALAAHGGNMMMDLVEYDDPGNRINWRIRLFSSEDDLSSATPDLTESEGLETGELARWKATKTIDDQGENEVELLTIVETHRADTPDVDA